MRKNLAVIFPVKETAIKFTAWSQQRNSCKRGSQCASALHSGELTLNGGWDETQAPLTALRKGRPAAPRPFALLARGCESQHCNWSFIHTTDTRQPTANPHSLCVRS